AWTSARSVQGSGTRRLICLVHRLATCTTCEALTPPRSSTSLSVWRHSGRMSLRVLLVSRHMCRSALGWARRGIDTHAPSAPESAFSAVQAKVRSTTARATSRGQDGTALSATLAATVEDETLD